MGPRFADNGSFEFEYGEKWKQLYEMKKQKLEALDREMKLEEDKLIAQMEFARYEHETETLKQQLQNREEARERKSSPNLLLRVASKETLVCTRSPPSQTRVKSCWLRFVWLVLTAKLMLLLSMAALTSSSVCSIFQ